ncbi:hypothetical protein ACFFQF_02080 [Haladaptatus pallidirubidus]
MGDILSRFIGGFDSRQIALSIRVQLISRIPQHCLRLVVGFVYQSSKFLFDMFEPLRFVGGFPRTFGLSTLCEFLQTFVEREQVLLNLTVGAIAGSSDFLPSASEMRIHARESTGI